MSVIDEYKVNRWCVTDFDGCKVNIWAGNEVSGTTSRGDHYFIIMDTAAKARGLWLKYREVQKSDKIKMPYQEDGLPVTAPEIVAFLLTDSDRSNSNEKNDI